MNKDVKIKNIDVDLCRGSISIHKIPKKTFEEIRKISDYHCKSNRIEWCKYAGVTFFKE